MLVRAGTAATFPVLFAYGQPDAGVTYKIYDPAGAVLASGVVPVPAGAVSVNVRVSSSSNALSAGQLLSYRDVEWSYEVGGQVFNDEVRYTIEARLPFGISADGVRAKLGVDDKDLPNSDISLVKAYQAFSAVTPLDNVLTTETAIGDAVEALAALALIPTMAVRIASKESSGTNQFQRQTIDWLAVQANLEAIVATGYLIADPLYDPTSAYGPLLIVVSPATDAITGA